MRHLALSACLNLLAAGLSLSAFAQSSGAAADLILYNGEVHSPDGWHTALAIRDGLILAVGDNATALALRDADTRMIDLAGATVLPGLQDLHVHPLGAGLNQLQCNFPQGSSRDTLLQALSRCAADQQTGSWISGGQWDAASYGGDMHRAQLDEMAPEHPVALVDISGHSLWVNSAALALAGITRDSVNPPGGIIERDASGEPTGVLRESAAGLVRAIIPPASAEQVRSALQWSLDQMLTQGITGITDAGVDASGMQAYAELADAGLLHLRVQGCMMLRGAAFGRSENGTPSFVLQRNHYARDRFRPDCVKLALDGVPTDGHTAAMVEPYAHTDHLAEDAAKGLLMLPQAALNEIVTDADRRGLTVKLHAAGDGAVRAGLDAIAAARSTNGFSGLLHNVAHNSFVQIDDIRRARSIAATFEMSPYIWFPNPIIPDISAAVGAARMQRWIPVKDAIDAGALVVAGSDWPVVPSFNPWAAIETLVTRQVPGGGGEVLGAAERISVEEAVALFTINAARQLGQRHQLGSIEPGLLADLAVIDRNPFSIPVTDIHATKVLLTIIEGEVVYSAER
jgi:predicted amidohydrolase YtcJ